MNDLLNEKLIQYIQRRISKKEDIAPTLIKLLNLSKEAVYRRLRGDTLFPFGEAVKIALYFGISIDDLISESEALNEYKWAFVDTEVLFYSPLKYMDQYINFLSKYGEIFFNNPNGQANKFTRAAVNQLPYTLTLQYDNLSLFYHYKWMYLKQEKNLHYRFSDLIIPPNVRQQEKCFIELFYSVPRILLILNKDMFTSTISDINYFFQRMLISEGELLMLKKELFELVTYMEEITASGLIKDGVEITIYLSDIRLDSAYAHLEKETTSFCVHSVYYSNLLIFNNMLICKKQKEWIESLKRSSTLITQSGEMQRMEYFRQQREAIKKLGS